MELKEILPELFLFTRRPNSTQRGDLIMRYFFSDANSPFNNVINVPVKDKLGEWYLTKSDAKKYFDYYSEELMSSGYLDKYKKRAEIEYDKFEQLCKLLSSAFENKEKISESIKAVFDYSYSKDSAYYFMLVVWVFDEVCLPELKKSFSEEEWEIITSQTDFTYEQKMRLDFFKLTVEELEEKYRYLGIYCPEEYGYTREDFEKFKKESNEKEIIEMKENILRNKEKYKDLIKNFSGEKLEKAELVNYNIYFRTIRMEKFSYCFSFLKPMYESLMKDLNFSNEEVGYLTCDEIYNYFKEGIKPAKKTGKEYLWYTQDNIREFTELEIKEFDEFFKIEHLDEFKGNVAYKGKAKGKVRIILSEKDLHKVEEGDIMVAQFTRPEYMSAIKKVKAIVTNDGGVTCHAAIVSRELKIPCIVGAKVATDVLKDGDLVEVDADTGVVKKIE